MLRVSKLADYATVVMVHMARHQTELLNAKDIAVATHLGQATVSKLLKILAKSGFLDSQQGAKGGYSLAGSPEDISIADIIRAVEGPSGLTACSHDHSDCSIEGVCEISHHWQVISDAIHQALQAVSLKALINSPGELRIDTSEIRVLGEIDA